jgi:hypothetical protein
MLDCPMTPGYIGLWLSRALSLTVNLRPTLAIHKVVWKAG